MVDPYVLLAFVPAALALNLTPGADMMFCLGQGLRSGRRSAVAASAGISAGGMVHVALAGLGLGAAVAALPVLFDLIRWLGVGYLLYLAWQSLRDKGSLSLQQDESVKNKSHLALIISAAAVNTLNPKLSIFFLAFLPQFVVEGAGPVWAQLFLHGSLVIVVAAFIEPPLILLSARLIRVLKTNSSVGKWMDRGLGSLFIFLGIRLALSEK